MNDVGDVLEVRVNVRNTKKDDASGYPDALKGFSEILESARLGAWELDLATGNIKRSLRHDQIFGYEVLQPSWTWGDSVRHIRANDWAIVKRTYLEALKTGFWQVEFYIQRPDRSLRWVAVMASILCDEDGEPERIVGVISDATEREQAAFGWRDRQARKDALQRSESVRRQTEILAETVLDSVTDAVVVYDSALRYVTWNRVMQDVTGISAEEALGRHALDVFPQVKDDGIESLLERALQGEVVRRDERPFVIETTGEELWIESKYSPHFDAEGAIIGVVGIIYDVTERRHAQENLWRLKSEEIAHAQAQEARRKLSTVLDSIADAFYAIDRNYCFTYVNQQAAESFGRNVDELIGKDVRKAFPEFWNHEDSHYLVTAMEERNSTEFESKTVDGQGWLAVRIYPSSNGGVSVYFHDLTQQKLAEQRLRWSEERFRGVIENSPDVVVMIQPGGEIDYASSSAEALLGYTSDELLGRNLFKKFPSETSHKLRNSLLVLMYEPEKMMSLELEVERQDGTSIYLDVRGRNLSPGSEVQSAVLLTMRDVTEATLHREQLEEAREKAEQMNQLKTSLLANMSHELHTPLTSLLAQANLLTREIPEEYHEALSRIERGARRLADTFNSVLALAQLEGSALVLDRELFDLGKEIELITEQHQRAAVRKGLKLEVQTGAKEIMVYTDPLYVSRVLNNLIENAIKFTESGKIFIGLKEQKGNVEIVVRDTGIGISEAFLPNLFGEFEQESTGLSRLHEGSGLGLAITKRMVETLKGSIEVESEPGAGSTFYVHFPAFADEIERKQRTLHVARSTTEESERRVVHSNDMGASKRKSRLMLVEDNEDIRPLLEQLLKKIGEVDAFSNAEAALECAAHTNYDLVLMDISLPKMSGLDAMIELRTMEKYDHVAMIAMTGHAIPGDRERFLRAGFDAYIAKPFAPSDLVSMVEAWI